MKITRRKAVKNLQAIIDVVRTTRGDKRELLVQFLASLTLIGNYQVNLKSICALDDQMRSSCMAVMTGVYFCNFGAIENWGVFNIKEIYILATTEGKRRYDEHQNRQNCPIRKKTQRDLLEAVNSMYKIRDEQNIDSKIKSSKS